MGVGVGVGVDVEWTGGGRWSFFQRAAQARWVQLVHVMIVTRFTYQVGEADEVSHPDVEEEPAGDERL